MKIKMIKIKKMNVKCCLDKWTNYKNRKRFSSRKVNKNLRLMVNKLMKLKNKLLIKKNNKFRMFHKGFKILITADILHKITDGKQKNDSFIYAYALLIFEFLILKPKISLKKPLEKSFSLLFMYK